MGMGRGAWALARHHQIPPDRDGDKGWRAVSRRSEYEHADSGSSENQLEGARPRDGELILRHVESERRRDTARQPL